MSTPSPAGAGLGATSSPGRRVPWAHSSVPDDGAGLTCAPPPQTTRCRISPAWASQPPSCCSSGSCSARLGMTAEEPETRPGAEHGDPAPPGALQPGMRASSPGASGRASDPGGRDAPRGGRRGAGGSASAHRGPSLPGRTPRLLSLLTRCPRRIPHGRGGSSPCTPAGSVHSHEGREPRF